MRLLYMQQSKGQIHKFRVTPSATDSSASVQSLLERLYTVKQENNVWFELKYKQKMDMHVLPEYSQPEELHLHSGCNVLVELILVEKKRTLHSIRKSTMIANNDSIEKVQKVTLCKKHKALAIKTRTTKEKKKAEQLQRLNNDQEALPKQVITGTCLVPGSYTEQIACGQGSG